MFIMKRSITTEGFKNLASKLQLELPAQTSNKQIAGLDTLGVNSKFLLETPLDCDDL